VYDTCMCLSVYPCMCVCERQRSLGSRRVWCVNARTRYPVICDLCDKSFCKSEIDSFSVKTPRDSDIPQRASYTGESVQIGYFSDNCDK